jgi:tRNA G18 (ribose-2'-O)-methylase SpoU
MVGLLEQSHARGAKELLTDKLTAGAGRRLTADELRLWKPDRRQFTSLPREPITLVLDGVRRNYNIGAMFRLADAFLLERLVICGTRVSLHKRKLVQAARGTQHWVPWDEADDATRAVVAAKANGASVLVVQQTSTSLAPEQITPTFPAWLVLGSEDRGVSQEILDLADAAVAIPVLGIGNSLNVATAAAIVLYWLSRCHRPGLTRDSLSSGYRGQRP